MATGAVKWFNSEKGFGFIAQNSETSKAVLPDVFVHYSEIQGNGYKELFEADLVTFEVEQGPKGLQAVNVVRTSPKKGLI